MLLFAGVLAIVAIAGTNTVESMRRLNITPGFGFLDGAANFEIGESAIPYAAGDSYARAILVGLINTLRVTALSCVLATVFGVALGIARLSGNLLLAGLVRSYVELVRNTPLLLQLFFWNAVMHALPTSRDAVEAFGIAYLSNRGIYLPAFAADAPVAAWLLCLAAVAAGVTFAVAWRRRTGRRLAAFAAGAVLAVGGSAVALLATGAAITLDIPQHATFNIRGGVSLSPEFAALVVALVVNASATVSEIVRGGIQSVPRGQWEAGHALGLRRTRLMRLVVLPQALRVITPLMTSTYFDITKNSSLAVAIGFPDLVNILNTTANTTGQALEAMAVMIAVYLTINLAISAAMNRYNRRVALRGLGLR